MVDLAVVERYEFLRSRVRWLVDEVCHPSLAQLTDLEAFSEVVERLEGVVRVGGGGVVVCDGVEELGGEVRRGVGPEHGVRVRRLRGIGARLLVEGGDGDECGGGGGVRFGDASS